MEELPISNELFISLIEERPNLWDKSLDVYKNKTATQNAWKEILIKIYPDFENWDEKQRQECAKKIITKWRHIRDAYFKSEKRIEGQKRSGSGAKTIKPYAYYKQLLFLKKCAQFQPTVTSYSQLIDAEPITETREENAPNVTQEVNAIENSTDMPKPLHPPKSFKRRNSTTSVSSVDAKMIKFLDSFPVPTAQPINRHISFFNGLIPTLDKFNDDQILDFQAGVIKLIKNIKNSAIQTQTTQPPQNYPSYSGHVSRVYGCTTPIDSSPTSLNSNDSFDYSGF